MIKHEAQSALSSSTQTRCPSDPTPPPSSSPSAQEATTTPRPTRPTSKDPPPPSPPRAFTALLVSPPSLILKAPPPARPKLPLAPRRPPPSLPTTPSRPAPPFLTPNPSPVCTPTLASAVGRGRASLWRRSRPSLKRARSSGCRSRRRISSDVRRRTGRMRWGWEGGGMC